MKSRLDEIGNFDFGRKSLLEPGFKIIQNFPHIFF